MKRSAGAYIFIKRFLLHTFALWLLVNISSWLLYRYDQYFNLAFTLNTDGSPLSFTDQFVNHNLRQPLIFWLLLIAFLAEIKLASSVGKKSILAFVSVSVLLGTVGSTISFLFVDPSKFYPRTAQFLETAVAVTCYIIGYSIVYDFVHTRYHKARIGQMRSESQLQLLKAQINPHFFFNTLNNLYGIALKEHAVHTAEGIELLAEMMRYNMDGVSEDHIDLETELKMIETYIALQRLRIPQKENIRIENEIDRVYEQYFIAPMLLIPLIENAFKYGLSVDEPCYVQLSIRVREKKLYLTIANSVFKNSVALKGAGLALNNVTQRLELLYPNKHQYYVEQDERNYKVSLSISLLPQLNPKKITF